MDSKDRIHTSIPQSVEGKRHDEDIGVSDVVD